MMSEENKFVDELVRDMLSDAERFDARAAGMEGDARELRLLASRARKGAEYLRKSNGKRTLDK